MKKYKVMGSSKMMDVEMNVETVEQASDLFDTLADSENYYSACIADNETGEVYCYIIKEVEGGGIKTTYWSVFE